MRESTQELFRLDGKIALVTGGNGGIGKGIARGLAGAGAAVAIAARNRAKTDEAVAEIKKVFGVEAMGITADMRKPSDVEAMVKQTVEKFGRIDIVVANAGIAFHKPPTELTLEEWDENIEINLRHTFVVAKAAYPHMKKAGGGKIITIGSMTSIFGVEFLPSYGASKGGILSLTRSLAVAWGKDNIQVNCILPGFIDSGISAEGRREIPGFEASVQARTPANRWGDPIDLAGTAVFLASPASDFVTGAAIPVDGGYAAQGGPT
ncbi:MAG TPA: glucose 1-dehydrogenase [Syntrophorhabdales bacterium]|nr:glucose 1-dehydrogenase [Syntrophorhabdales bacterium]